MKSFPEEVREVLSFINAPEADKADLFDNIMRVASGVDIEDCFAPIGHGSFKEAYEAGVPGWVIKFYCNPDMTSYENKLLALAQGAGLGRVFLPTYSVPFDRCVPAAMLQDIADEEEDEVIFLHGFMLQPEAIVAEDIPCDFNNTDPPELVSDHEFNWWCDEHPACRAWFADVLFSYGLDFYKKFLNFIRKQKMEDLYARNLGYENDKPIILDWMSDPELC